LASLLTTPHFTSVISYRSLLFFLFPSLFYQSPFLHTLQYLLEAQHCRAHTHRNLLRPLQRLTLYSRLFTISCGRQFEALGSFTKLVAQTSSHVVEHPPSIGTSLLRSSTFPTISQFEYLRTIPRWPSRHPASQSVSEPCRALPVVLHPSKLSSSPSRAKRHDQPPSQTHPQLQCREKQQQMKPDLPDWLLVANVVTRMPEGLGGKARLHLLRSISQTKFGSRSSRTWSTTRSRNCTLSARDSVTSWLRLNSISHSSAWA
jgi:hypothetical protein